MRDFSASAGRVSHGPHSNNDFVSTDSAALASHMSHCANGRGRIFQLQSALEALHDLVFPRMVTVAVVAVVLLGLVGTV
jgi:hypothetical protein